MSASIGTAPPAHGGMNEAEIVEPLARALAEQLRQSASAGRTYVAAIDRPACSGKSMLAERVLPLVPGVCLPTDDFHMPRGGARSARGPAPYRGRDRLCEPVTRLARGESAESRPSEWYR